MGKSINPADQHRREQRKKDLKKAKTARMKVRNEKLVSEPNQMERITTDIRRLENLKKHKDGYLDATDTKKLERLCKEQKILREHLQKQRNNEPQQQQQQLQKQTTKAESILNKYPQLSVYYDALLNPFGAAPPGQPMMYKCDTNSSSSSNNAVVVNGTTRLLGVAIRYAVKAGVISPTTEEEEELIADYVLLPRQTAVLREPANVLPPARGGPAQERPFYNNYHRKPTQDEQQQHYGRRPPPLPKNQQQQQKQNEAQFMDRGGGVQKKNYLPPPPPPGSITADLPPPLPPPSEAVLRSTKQCKKTKKTVLLADIWASNAELEYQAAHDENDDSDNDDVITPPKHWHYQDNQTGAVQGPFTTEQMRQWVRMSFFPVDTPVCGSSISTASANNKSNNNNKDKEVKQSKWRALKDVGVLQHIPPPPPNKKKEEKRGKKVHVTAGPTAVEDRIAALRANHHGKKQNSHHQEEVEEEMRMTSDVPYPTTATADVSYPAAAVVNNDNPYDEYPSSSSVTAAGGGGGGGLVEDDDEDVLYATLPYPPPIDDDTNYNENANNDDGASAAVVAPYPTTTTTSVDTNNDYENAAGYEAYGYPDVDVDVDVGVAPYPPPPLDLPVSEQRRPMLKKFRGDKALTTFVPTHVRVNRVGGGGSAAERRKKMKQVAPEAGATKHNFVGVAVAGGAQQSSKKSTSVADDYEDFMQEIHKLE